MKPLQVSPFVSTVIIVPGFADITKFGDRDGAILRFKSSIEDLPSDAQPLIINTAGFEPHSPAKAVSGGRQQSLAHQFKDWLDKAMPSRFNNVIAEPLCWGSGEEVFHGIKRALEAGVPRDKEVTLLIGVSDHPLYLRRMKRYVKAYMPKAWRAEFHTSDHKLPTKHEILGWIKSIAVTWRDHFRRRKP